jgi:hypothetical protein
MTNRAIRTLWLAMFATLLLGSQLASAATITIVNNDGAGEGFNDPAPRAAGWRQPRNDAG